MLKVSDNPPPLSPGFQSVRDLPGDWTVVQTKARAEKALAWALLKTSAAYFLPMSRRITFSGGRRRTGYMPVFAGYIFAKSCEISWRFGLASRHIARILPVENQGILSEELAGLERALTAGSTARFFPHIVLGELYRVTSGPLKGLLGVAAEFDGTNHIVLNVSILGQSAAIPVDLSLLERVAG